MKTDFGNYLFNVVIGFLLLVGGMSVADAIARTAPPPEVQPGLYFSLWSLAVLPFWMFYFWAKPTGNPLWMDFLFSVVTLCGLVTILVVPTHFSIAKMPLAGALWWASCHSVYFRWIAPGVR